MIFVAVLFSEYKMYKCSICHERFQKRTAAYLHKKNQHSDEGKVLIHQDEEFEELRKYLVRKIEPTTESGRPFKRFQGSAAATAASQHLMAAPDH